jgi:TatD DNase family protein
MSLFDVHAHLTHPKLVDDVPGIVARAEARGVTSIVSNGLNPGDNEAVRALAARYPMVRPAFGLYPVDAVLRELEALGKTYPREGPTYSAEEGIAWVLDHVSEAFAVGEIGLDGYWVPEELWPAQEKVFRRLVAVAMEADKAIIIHTRKRERRAFEILQEMGAMRVVWHCFGGKVNLARAIAEHGHYLSIPANARRSESFSRMLETLPRDRVLLETDCPYLSPDKERSSEPADVAGTAAFAAELWSTTLAAVDATVTDNFTRIFRAAP